MDSALFRLRKLCAFAIFAALVGWLFHRAYHELWFASSLDGMLFDIVHIQVVYILMPLAFSGLLYVLVGCAARPKSILPQLGLADILLIVLSTALAAAVLFTIQEGLEAALLSAALLIFRLLRRR